MLLLTLVQSLGRSRQSQLPNLLERKKRTRRTKRIVESPESFSFRPVDDADRAGSTAHLNHVMRQEPETIRWTIQILWDRDKNKEVCPARLSAVPEEQNSPRTRR
ncbi:hypothetical protein POX_f08521 [Penicillium oxalicum]|uniref:hypothetical protein n=1 Tax=Penicillium oxalicum TaxID=69781 RepID=UPI0020B8E89F|nr:hypothetical protein POX_f08521 [Penicillium oxalicum]KAI2788134.1 hypothetical protein POX_f08521 [Penicillium oxalicum]